METCPNCGSELPIFGGGAFCAHCGTMLRGGGAPVASQDATVILPAVSSAAPSAQNTWTGQTEAPQPAPDDSYAGYFRPGPGEPNPRGATQVIPAVPAQAGYEQTGYGQPGYGQAGHGQAGYGQPGYSGPHDGGGPYQDGYHDEPHRRGNVGVMVAVGVAVVAIAVIIGSVTTLGDHASTPAAQTPEPTQVVVPADTGTSASSVDAAPTDQTTAPTETSSSSSASPSAAAQTGIITGVGSSRCVDIPGANPADGSQLDLFDCNGTQAQSWSYVNGTLQAMGKCLDVRGASNSDRTPVQVFSCNGTQAQQWTYDPSTSELQTLGKCLDASGGGTGNGTPLILYTCHGGANQQWKVTPTS